MTAFGCGFRLKELAETEAKCKNSPLTTCQKTTYYLGRVVRRILIIPAIILFIVLQILSFICLTLELPTIKLEAKIRNIPPEQTTTLYLMNKSGINRFITNCNNNFLRAEASMGYTLSGPWRLEQGIAVYRLFLYNSLFTSDEFFEIMLEKSRSDRQVVRPS